MKIIVCGAGSVGRSIIGYLTQGNNDIIAIDIDQHKLDEVEKEWDIQPIYGSCSHPDVLEKAGAEGADMIIAATNVDEVNMITCQIAHSLFNVPKKIARIDNRIFASPLWSQLYNDSNIAIDRIISPDMEIANAIFANLKIPGASAVLNFADNNLLLIGFRCTSHCPHIKIPAHKSNISVVSVVRNSQNFITDGEYIFEEGDEIYFLTPKDKADDVLKKFGLKPAASEKIIIFGGNQISGYLAHQIEADDNFSNCKIIENEIEAAAKLARELDDTIVLHGEMMSDVILNEAAIERADATIAVTPRDKDNLLSSLLAKKRGVRSTISLVNSRSYGNLLDNVGDNILIDRSSVTISTLLKDLRKPHITTAYSLGRGFGEVWEVKIEADDDVCGKKVSDIKMPQNSKICAIYRDKKAFFPKIGDKILEKDAIIIFCGSSAIKKIETIFK